MGTAAEHAIANVTPPRRGEVLVLATDTTVRAYDLRFLPLAGFAPRESRTREHVFVSLTAVEGDLHFYFAPTPSLDLDEDAELAAATALAYAPEHCDVLKEGASVRLRIDRQRDKYLVVKGSAAGKIILRASSESYGD
ncbi:MAG: hypothetical protein KF894_29640 [Labilithrix sp.]|nr:hypothetical protein [Labilithrix sp.]